MKFKKYFELSLINQEWDLYYKKTKNVLLEGKITKI